MAKVKLLIDTDIFIDYFNLGSLQAVFQSKGYEIYYSIITKKELLSKPGLKESERQTIISTLGRYRIILLDDRITITYSKIRYDYPALEKEDALIAATALTRKLPLLTRNWKHYKIVAGIALFKNA